MEKAKKINKVFSISLVVVFAVVAWGLLFSESFETASMDIYPKGDCASSLQSTRHIYGRKAMPCV